MGYRVEHFVKKVDEHLICPICKGVFKNPLMCKEGHTFCKICIEKRLKESNKCPVDGRLMDNQILSPNFALRGILEKLDVFCSIPEELKGEATADLDKNGQQLTCDWVGKLHLLAKHIETCPFQQVQCPNANCNTSMQRRELKDHDMLCEYKVTLCHECRNVLIRHQLEGHKEDDCSETLVLCPNRCTDTEGRVVRFKRRETKTHLTNSCGRTIIYCPLKDQGCSVEVERQHVDKHVQDNMAAHMMLLAEQCSALTKENQVLRNKLKKFKLHMRGHMNMDTTQTKNRILKGITRGLKWENITPKNDYEILMVSRSRYVWTILDYPAKAKKYNNGTWMRSPNFWLCGNCWFLKLYPNGDKRSKKFVSLCLVLNNEADKLEQRSLVVPSSEVSVTDVRITVKNQEQETSITHDVTLKPSSDCPSSVKDVAVISELMRAADALSPAFCSAFDGSFTVSCILW